MRAGEGSAETPTDNPTAPTPGVPETAYQLLERVCEAIERSPQQFDQNEWVSRKDCGTSFCRAGWLVALHDGVAAIGDDDFVMGRAEAILDMEGDDAWELFSTYALLDTDARPGSVEYAAAGVDGTQRFMRKHEAHLKARRLTDVPALKGGR